MNLLIDMFLNLLHNPFAWVFLYFSFIGFYCMFITYHQRNPEKHLSFFKIADNAGAGFGIFMVIAMPLLTLQPRIYGSFGMFLTPADQIIKVPFTDLGPILGFIVSLLGIGITAPGIIFLILTIRKIFFVINREMFESKEILDTGYWGMVFMYHII